MNYLDIIIGIILIIFAIGGLRNGIIREAFSLVAFIGGIYGAIKLCDMVGQWLGKLINVSSDMMSVISFIVVFIALVLIINWLGNLIAGVVESISLGFIDKLGGIAFGIAKGFLLVGIIILLLDFFGIKDVLNKETCESSKLYKSSEKVATWIYENKDGWIEKINEQFNKAEDVIDEMI